MENKLTLGQYLTEGLRNKKWYVSNLEAETGLNKRYLQNLLVGRNPDTPRISTVRLLAEALDLDVAVMELLCGRIPPRHIEYVKQHAPDFLELLDKLSTNEYHTARLIKR
jgi:transcriptional regulator with XRE-family HTH domain